MPRSALMTKLTELANELGFNQKTVIQLSYYRTFTSGRLPPTTSIIPLTVSVAGKSFSFTGFKVNSPEDTRVDGTRATTKTESANRFTQGAMWYPTTCHIDTMLSLALCMNAGRTQADQVTPHHRARFSPPLRLLCDVVSKWWGTMSQAQKNRIRDDLMDQLLVLPPRTARTDFRNLDDVVAPFVQGLPQASFHCMWINCCSDVNCA